MLFETSQRSIRAWRLYWWVVMAAGPIGMFGLVVFLGGPVAVAIAFAASACGIMLLNGLRTVIGLRIWRDRLHVITPLSDRELRWDELQVRYYVVRLDMYAPRALWPYMYAPLWGKGRSAMHIIRQRARG